MKLITGENDDLANMLKIFTCQNFEKSVFETSKVLSLDYLDSTLQIPVFLVLSSELLFLPLVESAENSN